MSGDFPWARWSEHGAGTGKVRIAFWGGVGTQIRGSLPRNHLPHQSRKLREGPNSPVQKDDSTEVEESEHDGNCHKTPRGGKPAGLGHGENGNIGHKES